MLQLKCIYISEADRQIFLWEFEQIFHVENIVLKFWVHLDSLCEK